MINAWTKHANLAQPQRGAANKIQSGLSHLIIFMIVIIQTQLHFYHPLLLDLNNGQFVNF